MTPTQQRNLAFIINDFLNNDAFAAIMQNDHLDPSVRSQLETAMSTENVGKYVGEFASRAPARTPKKMLTEEEREEREAAKEARRVERKRISDEKKAAKKAAREAAKAAKRAAAGPGFTTREMTNDGRPPAKDGSNIMKGINSASLRIAKRKDTERGVWPMNQVVMKVVGNWADSDKAEFKRQFGEPMDISKPITKVEEGPNMAKILEAAVAAPAIVTAPAAVAAPAIVASASSAGGGETKTPDNVIADGKKARIAAKKAKLAANKAKKAEQKRLAEIAEQKRLAEIAEQKRLAEIAEQKRLAEIAEQKRLAEIAEEKLADKAEAVVEDDMMLESAGEEDFDEIEEDTPQPWSHHSYEGDDQLFKDEDNGVYRFDDESRDYEIIGFYYEDADGDIPADSLQLD